MTISETSGANPIRRRDALLNIPVFGSIFGVAVVFAILVVWIVAAAATGGGKVFADPDRLANTIQSSFYANMAIIGGFYVPVMWLMWRAAKRFTPHPIGWFYARVSPLIAALGLLAGVAYSGLCLVTENFLTRRYGIDFNVGGMAAIFPKTPAELALGLFVIGVLAPFAEEWYFRGFLLRWLRQSMSATVAVVITAVVFALVHFFMLLQPGGAGWVSTGEVVVMALVMAAWALRSGSLWPSFAIHLGYNAVVVVHMFLAPA